MCSHMRCGARLQLIQSALAAAGAPDSVRMQAAKFTEQLVLLLTAPTAPPPPAGAAASAGAHPSSHYPAIGRIMPQTLSCATMARANLPGRSRHISSCATVEERSAVIGPEDVDDVGVVKAPWALADNWSATGMPHSASAER